MIVILDMVIIITVSHLKMYWYHPFCFSHLIYHHRNRSLHYHCFHCVFVTNTTTIILNTTLTTPINFHQFKCFSRQASQPIGLGVFIDVIINVYFLDHVLSDTYINQCQSQHPGPRMTYGRLRVEGQELSF